MHRALRYLLLLLGFAARTAQAIDVKGTVNDAVTGLPLRHVQVRLEREGLKEERYTTRIDGFYRFDVKAGQRAVIRFERGDLLPRHVVFDASKVPHDETDQLVAEVNMRLFPPMRGADSALIDAPAGTAQWSEAEDNMAWDVERSAVLTARWDEALADHLRSHPEVRPSALLRAGAWCVDQVLKVPFLVFVAIAWALYWALTRILRRCMRRVRLAALLVLFIASAWCVRGLWREGGLLRFLALIGVFGCIWSAIRFMVELSFGRYMMSSGEVEEGDEDDDQLEGELIEHDTAGDLAPAPSFTEEVVERTWKQRFVKWLAENWIKLLLGASLIAFPLELKWGLGNTLHVWGLVRSGATVGLVIALGIARKWLARPFSEHLLVWSFVLLMLGIPFSLLGIAGASCLNRNVLSASEACYIWPVVDVAAKPNKQVWVLINGEEERLELDATVKKPITSLDSLRCCVRRGLLGFDYVVHVEPVFTSVDPR